MKEAAYSNPKLKQLLYMLYSKSDSEDLMWSVFDRCHADSSNIEGNNISLYAVADPNATPELLCDKGEPLFKLCRLYK